MAEGTLYFFFFFSLKKNDKTLLVSRQFLTNDKKQHICYVEYYEFILWWSFSFAPEKDNVVDVYKS